MEMLKKRINDKDKDVREVAKGALFVIEGMQKRTMRQDEGTILDLKDFLVFCMNYRELTLF